MRITESQLRKIVREEILRETKEGHDLEEAVQTREYKGKTYKSTPQAISILKKFNFDVTAAVNSGAFDWIKSKGGSPWAVAQAAHIVAKGEPMKRKPKEQAVSA